MTPPTAAKLLAVFFLAVVPLAGCRDASTTPGSGVVDVAEDDAEMNAAVGEARSRIGEFISALENPEPGQGGFSVKGKFEDGRDVEYMWVSGVAYSNGRFTGELDNDPVKIRSVKLGDRITIPRDEVYDWLFLQEGKIVGGFTIRVLQKRVGPEGGPPIEFAD